MIYINYQDRRPIYEQIVERFANLIVKGALEPGSQMPSVRQMAAELSINPNTIQKAYGVLEQEGYIYPVKGRGSFVAGDDAVREKRRQVSLDRLDVCLREIRDLGMDREECLAEVCRIYGEEER